MQSKYFNIKYARVIAFALLACSLSACEADDDAAGGAVILESFGPTGVKHGEPIKFIGHNLDQVTAIEFVGVTIDKAQFSSQTSGEIDLVIPEQTEEGKVILKTPAGDITSKTVLSFNVKVTVESVGPMLVKPGQTITITGEYVNWIKEVWFTDDVVGDEFVSKSLNEVVLTVPMAAQTGPISFYMGGTKPESIDWTAGDMVVTLPTLTSFSPTESKRGDELTITGTDLDLVMGVLFKGSDDPATEFKSQSETEIVMTIPDYANKGKISLVAFSGIKIESSVVLVIPLPPLEPLAKVIYDDVLQNGWQKWGGWGGGSSDLDNSDNVRDGDKGIKLVSGGDWGAPIQLGGGNMPVDGHTMFAISIFGTPGTGGKVITLAVKGGSIESTEITIVEGDWTEYRLPLNTTFGDPDPITEIYIQDHGWAGTLYVDAIGLR